MKTITNGHSAEFLKRKATKLKKTLGITHTEALNLVAKDHDYTNWDDFINNRKPKSKVKTDVRRPKTPEPAVLDCLDQRSGKVLGQRPNKKMAIRRHSKLGNLLQDLLNEVEYYKRAKNAIRDIRQIMDTWLGEEYNEGELGNAEFNRMYYSRSRHLPQSKPTQKQQAEYRRQLRQAKAILDSSYHDCKPLEKLFEKFQMAVKALENWPKNLKIPGQNPFRGQVPTGTFVRLDYDKKQIGMLFYHNTRTDVVEGYSDGGIFNAGRHEISVLRKQPELASFKPMRLYLPYGKWICAGGREVLFNRDYCPIWERSPIGEVTTIEPDVYVSHEKSEHYYDDRSAPYYNNNDTLEKCMSILKEWGVASKQAKVMELLPEAIAARDMRILSPKGIS